MKPFAIRPDPTPASIARPAPIPGAMRVSSLKPRIAFGLALAVGCAVTLSALAQTQDTWGSAPSASDDRFSNPKSKLYAGPNGWYDTGEVRATLANAGKASYDFKGGLHHNATAESFIFSNSQQLRTLSVNFGTEKPAPGVYTVASEVDAAAKKVRVSLGDVSQNKLLEWGGTPKSGTVTVSIEHGFLYFKARNLVLQPRGMSNTGDLKQPLTVGFEGAVAPR